MKRKLTITVDEKVYAGLHHTIGRRRIYVFPAEILGAFILRQRRHG